MVALFSMLFMQLAVASYACPAAGNPVANASPCAGMDPAQPSLCKAKAVAADLAGTLAADAWTAEACVWTADPPGLARSLSPPHAIEHCCLRH